MPLDQRLRRAFDRTGESLDPAVEAHLEATIRRATRPEPVPLGGFVLAALAVLVLVVGVRYLWPTGGQIGGPGVSASPSPSSTADLGRIAGRYRVELAATDPGVAELGLAGEWLLDLRATGVLELTAPPTFAGSRAAGHTFSLEGATFRTDLYYNDYCNSLGSYGWFLTGDELAFERVDDTCAIRQTLLSTRAWTSLE